MTTVESTAMRGIAAMLLAVALFAFMDAMMKHLVGHYPPMQVASLRGFASLPFVLLPVLLRGAGRRLVPVRWTLHLLRGVLGVVMLWSFVYSVRELSLADAYSIFLCAPLLVTALSVPLLGERVDARRWLAIAVGLAGVLLMLRPTAGRWVTLGGLAALTSALCYSVSAVTVRALTRTDSTESMVFWVMLAVGLGAGALAANSWEPVQANHWPWIVGIGLVGAGGQHFITEAFRHAPASVVAPFEYTALLWGVALDVVVWHVFPGTVTFAGGAIVVGAGLYLIERERRTR
jgi:drug/metabolite transporter (DMT)-like permease